MDMPALYCPVLDGAQRLQSMDNHIYLSIGIIFERPRRTSHLELPAFSKGVLANIKVLCSLLQLLFAHTPGD